MSAALAVLLTARDEEEQLPKALASIAGWAGEVVVVVDPRTTDRTREVADAAGARVLEHAFSSSAEQCNWGLARCTNRWVLVLDADERVTPVLRDQVVAALVEPAYAAFAVRRVNLALGKAVRFGDWGADRIVRLLDRTKARFVERAVHGAVDASSVGRLSGAILHDTLRSLDQYLPKLHDYAARGAAVLLAEGRQASPLRAILHGDWRFVRSYFLRLGFLDGGVGLVVAALVAYEAFLKWVLAWEATTRQRSCA